MRLNKISLACLALGGSALMVACGGSDSPLPVVTQQIQAPTIKGLIVNSYIAKAVVTLDFNDNGVCEATEPKVVSDADGIYEFPGLGDHAVCSSGGINTATGLPFVGELKGPKGGGAITPLTTLVAAQLGSNTNPTPAQILAAKSLIETQLNLPAGSISLDPVAAIATNPKLEQTNAAIQVMLQSITNSVIAMAGVGSASITPAMQSQVFADAAKAMVSTLTDTDARVDLTSATASDGTSSFVSASVNRTVVNVKTTSPLLVEAAPAGAVAALSPANAAAFVSSNIATLVQNTAQSTPTAAGIAAAQLDSQSSTKLINAIQSIVTGVPGILSTNNTAPVATLTALAAIVSPSASITSSSPTIVNTAALTTALQVSTVGISDPSPAATQNLVTAAANPPAEPVPQNVASFTSPVVAPLPPPIVNTVTITGST